MVVVVGWLATEVTRMRGMDAMDGWMGDTGVCRNRGVREREEREEPEKGVEIEV